MTMLRKRRAGRALAGAATVLLLVLLGGLAAWARPVAEAADMAPAAAGAGGGQSLGFNSARQMVKTGAGTYALVWTDGSGTEVVVGERRLGASSFLRETTVATGERIATPAIIASGDDLAVAWVEGGTVHARVRLDGSWLPSRRIGAGVAPSLGVTNGYFGLVWHRRTGETISFSRRPKMGRSSTWSDPVALAEGGGDTVSFASLAGRGGRFVAVWKRGDRGSWELEVARSDDQGKRWAAPRPIGDGSDPAVCLASAKEVWIGHQTTRGRIVVRRSTDGGATFTRHEVGDGWFAHVSCSAGRAALAWEETIYPPKHPDEGVKGFGLALVTAGGAVTQLDAPATAYVASATVLVDGERGVAAWIDTSAGGGMKGVLRVANIAF